MLSRSSRLPASLGIPNPSLAPPKARYICLQCRYRASHQQAPSRRPQTTPYSTPSLQRTYATGPIEKIQDAVTRGIGKRLFKKGEGPPLEGNVGQAQDEKTEPSTTQDTVPAVDDSDYTPAVSGEELETIGGPTGWWEEAWDAEHQFQGYCALRSLYSSPSAYTASTIDLYRQYLSRTPPRFNQLSSVLWWKA